MSRKLFFLALVAGLAASSFARAHDYKAGSLRIGHPWSRATPAGAKVAGGYLTIENGGSSADRLISATSEVAGRVEMHEMAVKDGIMTMRELAGGVAIAPGSRTEFKPGGYHLMLLDLKRPLARDERIKGTLVFEKAGAVEVEFKVEAVGARAPSDGAHQGH